MTINESGETMSEKQEKDTLFTKEDFPGISKEQQQKLIDNFNWLFGSDGAKQEDIHG